MLKFIAFGHKRDISEWYAVMKRLAQSLSCFVLQRMCVHSCNVCFFRVYFQHELAAKDAELTDQSHLDIDQQHHVWSIEQNENFNKKSAALR